MERDLPALWRSPEWRAEIEGWLLPALEEAGVRVTGPLVQDRVRFWSTVLHVETDAGRVWVKENAPSQAFEAGLVAGRRAHRARLVSRRWSPSSPTRGWFATADLGLPLWHDEDPAAGPDDWVVGRRAGTAAAQHVARRPRATPCSRRGRPALPGRLPTTSSRGSSDLLGGLRALPADDPRRPTDDEVALVDRGPRPRSATRRPSSPRADCRPRSSTTTCTSPTPSGGRPAGPPTSTSGTPCGPTRSRRLRIPLWIMRHRFALAEPTTPTCAGPATPASSRGPTVADRSHLAALLPPPTGSPACTARSRGRASSATCRLGVVDEPTSCGRRRVAARRRRRARPVRLGGGTADPRSLRRAAVTRRR